MLLYVWIFPWGKIKSYLSHLIFSYVIAWHLSAADDWTCKTLCVYLAVTSAIILFWGSIKQCLWISQMGDVYQRTPSLERKTLMNWFNLHTPNNHTHTYTPPTTTALEQSSEAACWRTAQTNLISLSSPQERLWVWA